MRFFLCESTPSLRNLWLAWFDMFWFSESLTLELAIENLWSMILGFCRPLMVLVWLVGVLDELWTIG